MSNDFRSKKRIETKSKEDQEKIDAYNDIIEELDEECKVNSEKQNTKRYSYPSKLPSGKSLFLLTKNYLNEKPNISSPEKTDWKENSNKSPPVIKISTFKTSQISSSLAKDPIPKERIEKALMTEIIKKQKVNSIWEESGEHSERSEFLNQSVTILSKK